MEKKKTKAAAAELVNPYILCHFSKDGANENVKYPPTGVIKKINTGDSPFGANYNSACTDGKLFNFGGKINFIGDYTADCWIKLPDFKNQAIFFSFREGISPYDGMFCWLNHGGDREFINFVMTGDDGPSSVFYDVKGTNNAWTHLAITRKKYDETLQEYRFFYNGKKVMSKAVTVNHKVYPTISGYYSYDETTKRSEYALTNYARYWEDFTPPTEPYTAVFYPVSETATFDSQIEFYSKILSDTCAADSAIMFTGYDCQVFDSAISSAISECQAFDSQILTYYKSRESFDSCVNMHGVNTEVFDTRYILFGRETMIYDSWIGQYIDIGEIVNNGNTKAINSDKPYRQ